MGRKGAVLGMIAGMLLSDSAKMQGYKKSALDSIFLRTTICSGRCVLRNQRQTQPRKRELEPEKRKETGEWDGGIPTSKPVRSGKFRGYLFESSGYTETGPRQVGKFPVGHELRPGDQSENER